MHTNLLAKLVDQDRLAVAATIEALRAWTPGDEARPTPCAGWDLGDLLAHMTVQQVGFARAVGGAVTSEAEWAPRRAGDPVAAYTAACDQVVDAFAALRDPTVPVHLPEVRREPVPAQLAVSFHLVDNVVHAWDVAASLGVGIRLDTDVLRTARWIAGRVPDGAERERAGAAFAHALPVRAGSSLYDEILLLLGRDPAWSAERGETPVETISR